MPIEIQVLNKKSASEAPEGKYQARYLNEKRFGILQNMNPCISAQIIEGIHSGAIIPYDSYVVTGDLPAQADVLLQNVKMLEKLAEAGRKITEQARNLGRLQEVKTILEDAQVRNGQCISQMEQRNKELNDELKAERNGKKVEIPRKVAEAIENFRAIGTPDSVIFTRSYAGDGGAGSWIEIITRYMGESIQNPKKVMGALVNSYVVTSEPVVDKAAELLSGVTAIVEKWWFEEPNGRKGKSHSDRLANDICDYIQQREDDKLPF